MLLLLLAVPAQAQLTRTGSFGLSGGSTRLTSVTGTGTAVLSGLTIGGRGRIERGMFSIEGAYRQGSLAADSGAAVTQDLVEGQLMVAVQPLSWLSVLAGPHARAFVTPGGTERWLFVEARLRAEGPVIGNAVSTHVELWTALGGSVNVGTGSPSARGGEAGLTVHLPRSPVWARLAYSMDRATRANDSRTVEDIRISVGIGNGK